MIRIMLLLLVFAGFAAQAGQMYKWVDDKGTTHYSATPPEGNAPAKKVDVTPVGQEKPRVDDWRERERASRERKAKEDTVEAYARKNEEGQRIRNCRRAQEGLDNVKNTRRLYHLDEKGERVYLEDKDRPAEIERWSAEVKRYC